MIATLIGSLLSGLALSIPFVMPRLLSPGDMTTAHVMISLRIECAFFLADSEIEFHEEA